MLRKRGKIHRGCKSSSERLGRSRLGVWKLAHYACVISTGVPVNAPREDQSSN
ncbi:MAG: hypothetical protein NVSMB27_40820 [Ktedonobacteraceae bacterium]